MTDTPLPLIIDCDPGIDDAVMLIMAFLSPRLNVEAITTVAGNVPLAFTSRNARMVCERMGRADIPVHAGCPRPMARKMVTAEDFHGESGIAGMDVFDPKAPLAAGHAVNVLIDKLSASPKGGYTVIISGPMTNLATALIMAPHIAKGIRELVIMGGADTAGGNITPTAEFNIYADPHAAAIVFDAGLPTVVLALDATHQVRAEQARVDRIRALPGRNAALMADLLDAANRLELRWRPGMQVPMHDPSTVGWVLAPHLFQTKRCRVSVVTRPGKDFGRTRVKDGPRAPHRWVTVADADGFFALVEDLLKARA
ncbi:nucleoside hydrolase [Hyphomonas sp.]|uniref:nucleoside hydrolase n=1 Tax=Hyphomonas sp. TaxID=87 RepID=UPI0025C6CEC0|nr:nucleoside hydrolase [Hyphomonas sp.]MBI1400031.1 nucleoside hydrolase [Hyphomonas sp.]